MGIEREVVCTLGNGILIIEPVRSVNGGEFAEQILSDLISEGYSGQELLAKFKIRQANARPAVEKLLDAAKKAADGSGEYCTYDDIFGGE